MRKTILKARFMHKGTGFMVSVAREINPRVQPLSQVSSLIPAAVEKLTDKLSNVEVSDSSLKFCDWSVRERGIK
jgi:hypothetical protein